MKHVKTDKKPLHILVVDDDRNFVHTLCAILQTEGYRCQGAYSGEAAQEILLKEQFDCVFSDVKMPNESGTDLYYHIKDKFPNIPFVLMTAYTSSEIIDKALKSGVLATFQKPIDIQQVLQFLAKINHSMEAAIICEEKEICILIQKIFEHDKFNFTIYKSTDKFIQSGKTDYLIVLVDAHQHCEHYSSDIESLLEKLPEKTIVIICDYGKTLNGQAKMPQRVNFIVLPRKPETKNKIVEILDREFLKHAKDSL